MVNRDIMELVELARQKLLSNTIFLPDDVGHMLAVLGQRFGLQVCFGHVEPMKHLERGVASHLRICISTTEDRMWSHTSYPSEPFLSCVAALALHGSQSVTEYMDSLLKKCLRTLGGKLCSGMIDRGKAGELTSRLLWLLAKDFFVRTSFPNRCFFYSKSGRNAWDSELIECRPFKVLQYLDFVFGEKKWPEQVEESFANAYINFSHWVSMDSDISGEGTHEIGYDSSLTIVLDANGYVQRRFLDNAPLA